MVKVPKIESDLVWRNRLLTSFGWKSLASQHLNHANVEKKLPVPFVTKKVRMNSARSDSPEVHMNIVLQRLKDSKSLQVRSAHIRN